MVDLEKQTVSEIHSKTQEKMKKIISAICYIQQKLSEGDISSASYMLGEIHMDLKINLLVSEGKYNA